MHENSSEKFIKILESISDAFFSLDNDLKVTYFNAAAEKMLGRKREEVLQKKLFDSFPEAKGSVFEVNYTKAVKEKIRIDFETYFNIAPYVNWYNVSVYPSEQGISVFFKVTTSEKNREEKIKQQNTQLSKLNKKLKEQNEEYLTLNEEFAAQNEELRSNLDEITLLNKKNKNTKKFYENIIENVQDGIWISDKTDTIVYVNKGMEKIAGTTKDNIIGKKIFHDFPEDSVREFVPHYIRAKNSKQIVWYEVKVKTPDARNSWQNGWIVPLYSEDQYNGMIVTIRDVTKKVNAEIKQQEYLKQLQDIEWLLDPEKELEQPKELPHRDLTISNKNGLIKKSIKKVNLYSIVDDFMKLLGTSSSIYEKDGSYAYGIFSSGYCRFLDENSFRLTKATTINEAFKSKKWHCHISCWQHASKKSIETEQPVDIICNGGLHIYAVPIQTSSGIIGSINFGYGNPPTDEKKLNKIALKYEVDINELKSIAKSYKTRPNFIIKLAKDRLKKTATLIAEMVERKLATNALKASEIKFRNAFDFSGIGMAMVSPHGKFLSVNKKVCEIFGYTQEELLQKSFKDVTAPEDMVISKQYFSELIGGKINSFQVEKRYISKSGEIIIGLLNLSIVRHQNGEPNFCIAQLEDITEKKRNEIKLAKETKRANTYLDIAGVIILALNKKGNIILVNQKGLEIFEYERNDIIGKNWFDHFLPVHVKDEVKHIFSQIIQGEIEPFEKNENLIITKTGEERIISWNNTLVKDEKGNITGTLSSGEDITEKKKAEEKLMQSENRFQTLSAQIPGVIYQFKADTKGNFSVPFMSVSGEKLFERPIEELITMVSTFDYLHSEDKVSFLDSIQKSRQELTNWSLEFRIITPSGIKWVKGRSVPQLKEDGSTIWNGVMVDITKMKSIEDELVKSKELAEQKERIVNQINQRLKILLDLNQLSHNKLATIYNYSLERAIEMSNSEIGFLGFLNDDETLVHIWAWSESAMKKCQVKDIALEFIVEEAGIWGEAIRQRKPLIINDYSLPNPLKKGIPEGHVSIHNYLSIPVFEKDKIVAVISVGNKTGDYMQTDLHELTLLMDGMWNIVKKHDYEKKLIESKERAERSEMRLKGMFNHMNNGVAIYKAVEGGKNFRFLDFNLAAEKITKIKKEQVIGKTLLEIFPNMDKAPLFKALQKIAQTSEDIYLPPFFYKDNVRQGWRENFIYKLKTGEIVTIFYDVTKQQEYQIALKESEKKFRTIFQLAEQLICIADLKNARFTEINPAFTKILGYSEEELLSKSFIKFIHPDDIEKTKALIEAELSKGNTIVNFTNRYICKNGDIRWFEWNTHPVLDKGIMYAIAHDVTSIKDYQHELILSKEKAEESDRLKTAFLNNISHEFRTPLNGILGFVDLLSIPGRTNEQKQFYTELIHESSERLLDIVTDTIEISQVQSNSSEIFESECNLFDIVEDVVQSAHQKATKKNIELRLKMDCKKEELHILSDQKKIYRSIKHLVDNAIKFTKEGYVEISCNQIKGAVLISIEDTGIGIKPSEQNLIFEPFKQVENQLTLKLGGSGIGLSLVKAYMEMLGGEVQLQSESNKGTIFTLKIPLNLSTASHINEDTNAGCDDNFDGVTILVAEDEITNYLYLEEVLSFTQANIIHAHHGHEAVEICRSGRHIDLILMDIKMPVMDGYEATKIIKSEFGSIPIIAQTAFVLEKDVKLIKNHGFDDYIGKPINKDKLCSLIKKHLIHSTQ